MNWYMVTWADRMFSEQLYSELIWTSEDRIREDLAEQVKQNPEDVIIQDIVKFNIMTGGNC